MFRWAIEMGHASHNYIRLRASTLVPKMKSPNTAHDGLQGLSNA
jgi:hypothetical protein